MPTNKGFSPIVPKKNPFAAYSKVQQNIMRELRDFTVQALSDLQRYPPARTQYRRTGDLGREWTFRGPTLTGGAIISIIGNNLSYAPWVQGPTKGDGPKQVALFAGYGWKSVTAVATDRWPRYESRIRQILKTGR